ncbi:MAG: hypothetical protein K2M04_03745 [Muribaculaceae bacterium]|nr:hypothetical protein [Muribaculaceae bacterium]
MKTIIKSFLASAIVAAGLTSCSPDDHSLASPSVMTEDLIEGIAYSVTPNAEKPNKIELRSLTKGATAVWNTPQGYKQAADVTLDLPFSGTYEVTYGIMTQAGIVWGEPYTFEIGVNDFGMLSDDIWTNLAGGVDENGNGNPKKWVPVDHSYGIGDCSAPVMYMSPDDYPEPELDNWSPNWDPGFQSWLIPADDPYMDSYMVFGLDPVKGATCEIYRNTANGPQQVSGNFNLNNSDPKHPLITFTGGTYSLHNEGFDGVCANYTNDIRIIRCNPYMLQIATMRTNSEGPWWIVWNFVAEDVQKDPSLIPSEGPSLIEGQPVAEPKYDDLESLLFTIAGSDATYLATQTTYLLNDEKPYDMMWWNPAAGAWEWIEGYGSSWAPELEGIEDYALTLEKAGKATMDTPDGSQSAKFTVDGNKIVFDSEITILSAGTLSVSGTEFTVMSISPDDSEVVLGVPVETDANGDVNKYLCANMKIKEIGGGQTGPIVIPVDNTKLGIYKEADKYLRIQFYNPWAGMDDDAWPIDPTKLKMKKDQKMVLKFTINGIEWEATPKAAFCCNMDEENWLWEPGCFDNFQAYTLNTTGENVMELPNTTGKTYSFYGSGSLQVTVQLAGFVKDFDPETFDAEAVTVNVTSLTIE